MKVNLLLQLIIRPTILTLLLNIAPGGIICSLSLPMTFVFYGLWLFIMVGGVTENIAIIPRFLRIEFGMSAFMFTK